MNCLHILSAGCPGTTVIGSKELMSLTTRTITPPDKFRFFQAYRKDTDVQDLIASAEYLFEEYPPVE